MEKIKPLSKYWPLVGLTFVSIIWGITFSFQKKALLHLLTFQFIFIRFLVAGITLMLIIKIVITKKNKNNFWEKIFEKNYFKNGIILGLVVFLGTSCQQLALIFTSVANTGFITTAYVVVVPIIVFIATKSRVNIGWTPAFLSFLGMFILSGANFTFNSFIGDTLALANAIFWGFHLVLCQRYAYGANYINVLTMTMWQSLVTSVLALLFSLIIQEPYLLDNFQLAWVDVLFSGALSAGIANFIQILSQRKINPTHAAVILSLEGLFAAIAAWLIVKEALSITTLIGGMIIIISCIISQRSADVLDKLK